MSLFNSELKPFYDEGWSITPSSVKLDIGVMCAYYVVDDFQVEIRVIRGGFRVIIFKNNEMLVGKTAYAATNKRHVIEVQNYKHLVQALRETGEKLIMMKLSA